MLLWERVAPSHVGRGGFRFDNASLGAGWAGRWVWLVLQSLDTYDISLVPQDKYGYRMIEANTGGRVWYRAVLWVHGEQARGRYGYAGDGG